MNDTGYFRRELKLYAGNNKTTVEVTGLRVEFDIAKTDKKENNQATITVWNLQKDTQNVFDEIGTSVTLEAGYQFGIGTGVIFSGKITKTDYVDSGADKGIKIDLADGVDFVKSRTSKSWSGKVLPKTIILDVCKSLGVNPVFVDELPNNAYNSGFVSFGSSINTIQNVLNRSGYGFTFESGQITIFKKGNANPQNILFISPSSGLVGTPRKSIDQETKKAGYKLSTLLNPTALPKGIIVLDSSTVKGEFVIKSVRHFGDTFGGQWATEIEGYQK